MQPCSSAGTAPMPMGAGGRSGGRAPRSVDCDVVVAGGGPAGAAAAITLAQAGLHAVVIDQKAFPRDKVCGDFVSPLALQQLRTLGVDRKRAITRSNRIHNAAAFLDGTHLLTQPIPTPDGLPVSRVIPRETLDHLLLNRARSVGADIRQMCRLVSFQVEPDHVRVSIRHDHTDQQITARMLIGADGSTSAVARLMRGSGPADDDRIIAVRGYFDGVDGPPDRADLYFASGSFPGYCWLFPVGGGAANVGLGVLRNTLPAGGEHLRTQLERMIATDDALKRRLGSARPLANIVGWPLTTYNGEDPLVGDRTLLVGDAAGLINPLNGEGIQYALLSGIWAGETVLGCAALDFSQNALQPYAQRVAEELGRDFALTRALVQLIRNQSLNPIWLKALRVIVGRAAADAEYARVAGGVLAGIVPAREVINLNIVRKTIEQGGVQAARQAAIAPLTANGLLRAGINATEFAIDVASTMLHDRASSERWVLELAARAWDLVAPSYQQNPKEERHGEHTSQVVGQ
jgi:geranylgeranyl reductase family protein